jgi:serine/threonine protein kinase
MNRVGLLGSISPIGMQPWTIATSSSKCTSFHLFPSLCDLTWGNGAIGVVVVVVLSRAKRRRKWDKMCTHFDPEAKDLLESLMQYDPTKRMTAEEALQHSFFTKYGSSLEKVSREGVL